MNTFRTGFFMFAVMAVLLASPLAGRADVSMYLWIDGIAGESQVAGYEGWIECTGFGHSISLPHHLIHHQPLQLTKKIDSSSPVLTELACEGRTRSSALIDFADSLNPSNRYFQIKISSVLVTAVGQQATSSTNDMIETIALDYDLAQWSYTEYVEGQAGTTTARYGDTSSRGGLLTDDSDGDSTVDMYDSDDDNDGVDDYTEAVAGTDALNANSLFDINITSINTNQAVISWTGQDARTYQIMYSTNLANMSFATLGSSTTGNSVTADVTYAESAVFRGDVSVSP